MCQTRNGNELVPAVTSQKRFERRIKRTKLAARSELKTMAHWQRFQYAESMAASYPFTASFHSKTPLERIHYMKTSIPEFIYRFEKPAIPVIIEGITQTWPAHTEWTAEKLTLKYFNEKFKVGEDDDGNNVYMSMKYFMHYALKSEQVSLDDSPLYIFDSSFADRKYNNSARKKKNKPAADAAAACVENTEVAQESEEEKDEKQLMSHATCALLQDYKVPKYFTDDLFQLVGERRRPPYRWMVIGPARSGTGIHVDPLGTSAWNALVVGHKRWILFPPHVDKSLVDPGGLGDHEAVTWFAKMYPKMMEKNQDGETLGERLGMIEAIQKPGDTMFVPGGWWHVVMNLDFTIAVTQNYCSRTNFECVWLRTRHARPKLAASLRRRLQLLAQPDTESLEKKKLLQKLSSSSYLTQMKHTFFETLVDKMNLLDTVPEVFDSSDSDSSSSSSTTSSEGTSDSSESSSEEESSRHKRQRTASS